MLSMVTHITDYENGVEKILNLCLRGEKREEVGGKRIMRGFLILNLYPIMLGR
jgi:hypothetical protein